MKTNMNIFCKDDLIRSEKVCTLAEYLEMGRIKSGQLILIGEIKINDKEETHSNTESFFVGDCTPFHEPSLDDGGFGWDEDNPRMKKYVLEVHVSEKKDI